jgi:putative ABC transport system permease protein
MDTFLQDVRFALRTLAKNRGFTTIAIICLALGIGVNATIFSVVHGVLIKPFPYKDPERIVSLHETVPKLGDEENSVSYLNFRDWQEQNKSFVELAGVTGRSISFTEGDEPERVTGSTITWNLFPMLGVAPQIGRVFRPEEDSPGAPGAILIGDGVWTKRFNRDPTIVGRTISVNGLPHTVVGVMPRGFRFPENTDSWLPMTPLETRTPRGAKGLQVFGRLRPGVEVAQANREMEVIAARLAAQFPDENKGWSANVWPLRKEFIPPDVSLIIWTMMGAVSFVLLIACANVANLMLARASGRAREMAVRAAIGAGRGRIVRQLLTESVLIGLAAGAVGVPLTYIGVNLIDLGIPTADQIPYYITWTVDRSTLAYTLVASILTGIVFGLAPALQASRGNLAVTLREGGGRGGTEGVKRNRLRNTLVVTEVALSLILLVGASLFVRSFVNLQTASGGFDTAPLMTMRIYLPGTPYDSTSPKSLRVEDVMRRIEAIPGVQYAAASNELPLSGGGAGGRALIEGKPVTKGEEPYFRWTGVTAHWWKTMGVPIAAGRDLTEQEAADSSPVAVINRTMAKELWDKGDALQHRFRFAGDTAAPWITVVGIINDIKDNGVQQREPQPAAYIPFRYLAIRNTAIMVRVTGSPSRFMPAIRQAIRASDPSMPVFQVQTMEAARQIRYWQFKLFGWMFSAFGAVALFLAAVGVYGVISYGVSQRTQEIGVRVALGAQRRDVLRLVMGQGARLAGIGVAAGVVSGLGVTRVLQSQLFEVSPSDPLTYVSISVFLTGIAMIASWVPARRATSVDPLVALRAE